MIVAKKMGHLSPRREQNGELSDHPLIMHRVQTKYKTFGGKNEEGTSDIDLDEYDVKWYDVLLALVVMSMGVSATMAATYSSWTDAISSATFTQPCLLNSTAAARSFIEATYHISS
ncbi:hypothetical protein KGM_203514 [Danaus plexippus plexippus]|uniref:Uncharacterized protein n=2 Tax=Danaus plexippus TaxID=13037 RepID=A0A212F5J5_DANPL|nr:hypothetical protein KGM_203514 [Danaus plexippus plexippus]